MTAPFNPLPISVSPSWEDFTRRQASNRHPTLTCCFTTLSCSTGYRRTRSTLGILRISSFVQGASRSRGQELRTPATSFQNSEMRLAAGRRHHRRRDEVEEHAANLDLSKVKPEGPEKVQSKNSKGGGTDTDDKVVITLDMDELKHRAAETVVVAKSVAARAVVAARRAAERSIDTAVQSAKAAAQESGDVWRELRTSVRVQRDKHLVISIRRSSLIRWQGSGGLHPLVVFAKLLLAAMRKYECGRKEGFSRSNRVVQDRSLGGTIDYTKFDRLRQLCKAAGVNVKFDTYNTRDTFYRAAINIVLSACQRASKWSMVEFGSEGGIRLIAGLASNIGLESDRVATMVNAAVAVRTRAGLLQARALGMQSKSAESEEELLKLIRLHCCFRPDLNSAEMEMVAQGLWFRFDREGRIEILQIYKNLGSAETKRVAEEALGLLLTS